MIIGETIKKLRKQARCSIENLAHKINRSVATLSSWEKGYTDNISTTDMERLAEVFQISLEEFYAMCMAPEGKPEQDKKTGSTAAAIEISKREMNIIEKLRKLSARHRKEISILSLIKLASNQEEI